VTESGRSRLSADARRDAAALAADRSAIAPASIFDAGGFACTDSAEIRDWDPRPSFRVPKALKLTDRPARFAVAAARMALVDARWDVDDDMRQESLAVVIGSSGSDLQARDLAHALGDDPSGETANDVPVFADRILNRLNPLWLLVSLPNMTSAHVAIQVQARGPNSTIMSDWTAGLQAIGEAVEWISAGEADAVLAGG
jgi:3-oxoacyl-[acyl-carrier-protein] synthase II